MNVRTWFPLVLALALGLIAMQIARNVISKNKPVTATEGGTSVVVVKSDLPAGSPLTAADLTTVRMGGEINSQAIFTTTADLEGRVLTLDAAKGTPVLPGMLAPKGVSGGLQALIPDGMRAVTVEINEFSGVAGYLVPGCRVDIVATFSGEAGEIGTRTIVQNVRVQATGMRQQPDPNAPVKSITLVVTPREAEAIELACATGKPRLVLRGSLDNGTEPSEGITVAELRTGSSRIGDPFGTQAVELIKPAIAAKPLPVVTTPTSQPTQGSSPVTVSTSVPEPRRLMTRQRQVQVIRGGVESAVTFEEVVAPPITPKWMTGANTDELPANK
ncbi:MAG TPA: Flp pilus assembly protein CpaB [Tepidisphaeraceae bacterium]|jgi:pilus assembly protein CpaB